MIQRDFAFQAKHILENDADILGLAAGGSWLTIQLDEYSDLDLILVTKERNLHDRTNLLAVAHRIRLLHI